MTATQWLIDVFILKFLGDCRVTTMQDFLPLAFSYASHHRWLLGTMLVLSLFVLFVVLPFHAESTRGQAAHFSLLSRNDNWCGSRKDMSKDLRTGGGTGRESSYNPTPSTSGACCVHCVISCLRNSLNLQLPEHSWRPWVLVT